MKNLNHFLIIWFLIFQGIISLNEFPTESTTFLTVNNTSIVDYEFDVLYYELYFDIDPVNDHFRSVQNITIFTLTNINSISFYLHSDLVLNDMKVWDNETNDVLIDSWEMDYNHLTEWHSGMKFALVEVNLHDYTDYNCEYWIHLDYSLKPEAIADDVGEELLRFTVSEKGTRALGWPSGIIPVFVNGIGYAVPHCIEIKHPNDMMCIATGTRISMIEEGDYIIETYSSNRTQSTAPSFSCDAYKIITMTQNNITLEFFYFEGEAISEEILNIILQGILLFTNTIGDIGDRHYQIGYVEVEDSFVGGTSRRDTIFIRTGIEIYKNFKTDLKDKVLLVTNLLHEIAHNWNGFVRGESWRDNKYFLWYQEGGANFLASWACEMTMGAEAASIYRKYNLERYEKHKGYDSSFNLKNVQFTNEMSDVVVAYEYAGLVWEQLFLKLGNETFFKGLAEFTQNYWINDKWNGLVTISNLFDSFEKYTEINVEGFLDQWGTHNAKINLLITNTHTEKEGNFYETTVEINVITDRDYEIFTSIGYNTDLGLNLVGVHITESGKHTINFTSEQEPKSIKIDPEYRVPRLGVYNPIYDIDIDFDFDLDHPVFRFVVSLFLLTVITIFVYIIIRKRRKH